MAEIKPEDIENIIIEPKEHPDNVNDNKAKADEDKYVPGSLSIVYVTVPSMEIAKTLATGMVEKRLAACVNIIPNILSIYKWDGEMCTSTEMKLMIKTETLRVDSISQYMRENHPYDVAEVISVPIENGNKPYLDYIKSTLNE